jgi:hypothetical protein
LLLGLLIGGGSVTAYFLLREKPPETAKTEPPKQEPSRPESPKQELPAIVDPEAARKNKALLDCTSIATAIEAYTQCPQNPGITEEQKMPSGPLDLLNPPFGGPSFLRNGQPDLLDPWGNPYQFQTRTRKDNTSYILVTTTAPDQTPISQFGIGENAKPRE